MKNNGEQGLADVDVTNWYAFFLGREIAKWAPAIKAAGAQVDRRGRPPCGAQAARKRLFFKLESGRSAEI